MRPLGKDHLPGCEALPLESPRDMLYPDTTAGGYDDEGVYFIRCVEGCPALKAVQEFGRHLAREHGW